VIKRIQNFLIFVGLLVVTSMLGYLGYVLYNFEQPTPEQIAQRAAEQAEASRKATVEYLSGIEFFRDTTTGLCFVYIKGTPHGLGLDAVDCTALSNSSITEFASRTK
jgi:flagellar basal body-associated protein FliL